MNGTITIDNKYYSSFARIFSPIVMDRLINTGKSGYLSEVLKCSGLLNEININTTVSELFEQIYQYLFKHYRSEYIYKNAIANKILLGRHSLNTSHMLTEFRVANCKADVVILNGTSTVYEIKSEYDSLDRLHNQTSSYLDVFDHIYVITSYSQLTKVKSVLPSTIGLLVLTSRNTIKTIRVAESGRNKVKPEIIFDSLKKSEYISIIKKLFGYVPDVSNTQIYKECRKLFCSISRQEAHDEMVKVLRRRGSNKISKDFVNNAPTSLKAYAISARFNKRDINKFFKILENKSESIMIPVM